MIMFILQCVYLMLPAYFANMAPVFVKKIKLFDKPISKELLGSHKTWRGLVFGIIAGIILAYVQFILQEYEFFFNLGFIDYYNWLGIGFLLGAGALIGDAVKSFFKRRAGVKPGGKFIPWDQIDYSLGSLLFISVIFMPSWQIVVAVIIINFILHVIVNHLAYYLKITDVKW
ncbi:CDP-archaeol synthase [Candidatus Woesearchaeota archaeon]|nr:CDP-archaeol synthase [Candidatus Woesearchaeota archaeon]